MIFQVLGWIGVALVLVGPQLSRRRWLHLNALFATACLGAAAAADGVIYILVLQVLAFTNNAIALRRFWNK